MTGRRSLHILAAACVIGGAAGAALAHPDAHGRSHFKSPPMNPTAVMRAFEGDGQPAQSLQATIDAPCVGGFADIFPCSGIDLLSLTPIADLPGTKANDIWGWESGGREFALIGLNTGAAFVEVTNPTAPVYVGWLPSHGANSDWRDIKVHANHAFIVSEASGHGMQVFNLMRLLTTDPLPITFDEDAVYNDFGNAHNIAINEASGFAYVVGSNTCSGGLHMIDISNPLIPKSPLHPTRACYAADGYTHDVQCVNYAGPDSLYAGREICFAANEDTLTIVDVTDKGNPAMLSRTTYPGERYTHQAWLDESHEYLFLDDELDESSLRHDTLTRVWDVSNLLGPTIIDEHANLGVAAIDHNQYVRDDLVYQANYRSGLRVLEILRGPGPAYLALEEIGYFDVYPSSDSANFNGAWSNYPFLPSGNILISGIEQGLFVVALNIGTGVDEIRILAPGDGAVVSGEVAIEIEAVDAEGGAPGPVVEWAIDGGAFQPTGAPAGDVYSAAWSSGGAAEGWRDLTARMTDSGSNVTTAAIQVFVNNLPPTVQLVSPEAGPVSGNVALAATTDADGSVVSVTFYDGADVLGVDGDPSDGFAMNWNTKRAPAGDHVLTARATDNRGQMTTSSPVTVTVTSGKGGGGGPGGGGGGSGGGGGGDKCFKNKAPLCDP